MCISLTKNKGWKPHVIYDSLGITRTVYERWALKIYPLKKLPNYSSYDIVIFMLIREYHQRYGMRIDRLGKINWHDAANSFKRHKFATLINLTFNVDLGTNKFGLYSENTKLKHPENVNFPLELKSYIKEVKQFLYTDYL